MKQLTGREKLRELLIRNDPAELRALFSFDSNTPNKRLFYKFKIFARRLYPRFFRLHSAKFHDEAVHIMIKSYRGEDHAHAAFRGAAKTALKKLFDVFVLLNDQDKLRKYIKVLSRDLKNSKQITTDVYNLIIEVIWLYGNVFASDDEKKREETMGGFTMRSGVKYTSGTVGMAQRGHQQDAYRPDWIWFEDVEDGESSKSQVMTEAIIQKCDEAITGLSTGGSYYLTCNYISDHGVVQWFFNKKNLKRLITPIEDEQGKSVWPEAYSEEKLKQLKEDSLDWYGDYMCDPVSFENAEFKKEWFQTMALNKVPDELRVITSVDLAISKKDSADESVVITVGVDKYNTKYLLKLDHGRWDPSELIDVIWDHYTLYLPERVIVETVAYQAALSHFLRERMRLKNEWFQIEEARPKGDKESRIRGLIPHYRNGAIIHVDRTAIDLQNQALRFPAAKHDDMVDALAMQIPYWQPPRPVVSEKKKNSVKDFEKRMKENLLTDIWGNT